MAFRGKDPRDSRAPKITLDRTRTRIKADLVTNNKGITLTNPPNSSVASLVSPREDNSTNIIRITNTPEASLIMTCRGINWAPEDSLVMTCRGTNKATKLPGSNTTKVDSTKGVTQIGTSNMTNPIEDRAMAISSIWTQEKDPLVVDRVDQGPELIAEVITMTLVMGVINEETARRS